MTLLLHLPDCKLVDCIWVKVILTKFYVNSKIMRPIKPLPCFYSIEGTNWSSLCFALHTCSQFVSKFATPWTVACQAPLSIEFYQQEGWSVLPFPTSEDFPSPGVQPMSLVSPALTGRFFIYHRASLGAQLVKNLSAMWEAWVWSLGCKIPWRREKLPTPVFRPGEFHGLHSPWGLKELDTTWATFTFTSRGKPLCFERGI